MADFMKTKIMQGLKKMGCVPDFPNAGVQFIEPAISGLMNQAPTDPRPNKWAMTLGFAVFLMLFISTSAYALETAPRISDKEIVERLTKVEEGIKALDKRIDDTNKRIDDRFDAVNKRIDDTNRRIDDKFEALDKRIDMIMWILGLFVSISMVTLGAVIRLQWQMMKRQTRMETSLETQKDELAFLKGLIEKLLPPKGVL